MAEGQIESRNDQLLPFLQRALCFVLVLLFFRILYQIVEVYPAYFPADFESAFLTGREPFFHGLYRASFYVHIISGPLALLAGFVLMNARIRKRYVRMHRCVGRLQILNVVCLLGPTGLVMATRSYTGPIAGFGFGTLSVLTVCSALATVHFAAKRRLQKHELWARRCFILLCSPLLLRLMSGVAIVFQFESIHTYRFSAWASWILPIVFFELWNRVRCRSQIKKQLLDPNSTKKEKRDASFINSTWT